MRPYALAGLVTLTMAGLSPPAASQSTYKLHKATVTDGDSITIPASGMVTGLRLRALGYDAPELNSRCAAERQHANRTKDRLAVLALRGLQVSSGLEMDAYGRILASLRTPNGADVADILISEGLARAYSGKAARTPWCDAAGNLLPP